MQKLKTSHLPAEISNCLQSKSYCKLVAEDSWSGLVQLNKGRQAVNTFNLKLFVLLGGLWQCLYSSIRCLAQLCKRKFSQVLK